MAVRITAIHKRGGYEENANEVIDAVAWKNEETGKSGRSEREQMWIWLQRGGEAFVIDAAGNTARVRAKRNSRGRHFLEAEVDDAPTDALLDLPHF